MPTAPQTQAETRRRVNCTRTAGIFEAGDLSVCRAGDLVALHVGTPSGTFVFRLNERVFIRACRGPVDHNGNPFRTIDQLKALGRGEVADLQADAAAMARPEPLRLSPDTPLAERRAAAWASLQRDPAQCVADVARDCGLGEGAFSIWLSKAHRGELRALRQAAGTNLCIARRPKNLTAAAASGAPLEKPSGGI